MAAQDIADFDASFQIISTLLDALQRHFKHDTGYTYPLMPPQSNMLFALDSEAGKRMAGYMSQLMKERCGFGEEEFRFAARQSNEAGGLCSLRLEFCEGLTFETIRKISAAASLLEDRLAS